MQPKFTMQYGEFAVADYLRENIKNSSVFIPASAQEKGIDLLLYRFKNGLNTMNTIQVKMSRTYYGCNANFHGMLWFNRFDVPENADWIILVGIYAKYPNTAETAKATDPQWDEIMLAFTNKEMKKFMDEVRLKGNPEKFDKMFGFGFNGKEQIIQTRGCPHDPDRDMSAYLIENRLTEIENSFR